MWIGHAIQSVLDFIKKPEIIIVDNNSSDRTLEIVKRFQHDPNLEDKSDSNFTDLSIHSINDYTPGKALNLGISKASYDYILILSSHCVITKLNIDEVINDLLEYQAIFGNQLPIMDGKKVSRRYLWSHFLSERCVNLYSEMEGRYFFHNAFSLFNKDFLTENPFDEYLTTKEDRYWAQRIISKNYKILYNPENSVNHYYTVNGNTWKGLA